MIIKTHAVLAIGISNIDCDTILSIVNKQKRNNYIMAILQKQLDSMKKIENDPRVIITLNMETNVIYPLANVFQHTYLGNDIKSIKIDIKVQEEVLNRK